MLTAVLEAAATGLVNLEATLEANSAMATGPVREAILPSEAMGTIKTDSIPTVGIPTKHLAKIFCNPKPMHLSNII